MTKSCVNCIFSFNRLEPLIFSFLPIFEKKLPTYSIILGGVTYDYLGLPSGSFEKWLNAGPYLTDVEVPISKPKTIKNPEIPVLKEITVKI